ncbi:protein of unknown function DUF1028 [Staphylothermus marinus F1]|uniref:DUF1028 domain-containing protein n=1 Tax=Staphylothermus marinus (strain ATCC 43588 / DSM 3639 / JCM 9404 / F1) TaxID=399550 RepID=A3DKQ7_STAMF|nr:DUF1028 domain-containing protein [Staphylothermus marinus]ABN69217.1 protein of unknown function DUF1028 [Staphylothermus marinus F1]
MTYSLVGFDPKNNVLGVGVVSGSIAVGSRVPWAKYLVGGVATQAYTNPSLGPIILGLLEKGYGVEDALMKALENDLGREYRQVAVLSWNGSYSFYNGKNIPENYSGYGTRNCVSIANLVVSKNIPYEMCTTFLDNLDQGVSSALLHALEKGHSIGGDKRGDRSAAILVVGKTDYGILYDKLIDLRIDYSHDPVKDLAKLYMLYLKNA